MESKQAVKPRSRNPEATRERLVATAFDQFQRTGYNATALRDIVRQADTTSGALFHHFENKEALGIAVLEGPVAEIIEEWWIRPLAEHSSAVAAITATLAKLEASMTQGERRLGCPLGNAASELTNQHAAFAAAVRRIYERWHRALSERFAVDRGQGSVRADVDPDEAATFVIVGVEGAIALTKALQSAEPIRQLASQLERYFAAIAKPV